MKNYKLLDSGNGEKLEMIGEFVLRRPDPEVLWSKSENLKVWENADLSFERIDSKTGVWRKNKNQNNQGTNVQGVPEEWLIEHGGLVFLIRPTSFKHMGIFPEQISNWEFIETAIRERLSSKKSSSATDGKQTRGAEQISVLNLFGYTGGATLACAKAGAEVTHVDASKPVIDWAKKNAEHNNLVDKPIRWLIDDAMVFVKREVKRGKKYDAIVMDPPAFGRGPDGEVWKIEENFLELFSNCVELLSDKPIFFIISGYASGYSGIAFANCLKVLEEKFNGNTEILELTLKETSARGAELPAGVTARWCA